MKKELEMKEVGSAKFNFDNTDLLKVLKTGSMVGVAAALGYVVENFDDIGMGGSFIFIVPLITMALNAFTRWIKDNETVKVVEVDNVIVVEKVEKVEIEEKKVDKTFFKRLKSWLGLSK